MQDEPSGCHAKALCEIFGLRILAEKCCCLLTPSAGLRGHALKRAYGK